MAGPKQGTNRTWPRLRFLSQRRPNPVLWRSDAGSQAPRFQSWAGLAPLGKETSIGSLGTLLPEQGWAAKEMPPRSGRNQPVHLLRWRPGRVMPAPGTAVAGERSPLARCTRGAPRVGRRRATGEGPVGEGKPVCLYLSPRSGAAEPVATGGGQRAQSVLAFHTASRASAPRSRQSFIHTAQPGGGGAEREPGSCDRRLGVLALPRRSLRMRATEGPLQAPRPGQGERAAKKQRLGGASACATAIG